ncbi:unnamed protein product [Rhizoctonia solani]|uniref:Uncharacterized protein n=1 Tax=Rhizoctonia solani TaxID=456999 RepID=A0A8H3HLF0_9AGAM|nr:unnamed protein product [Rhizoctonia solani]
MIFLRSLCLAVAAIGVLARQSHPEKRGMVKVFLKLGVRDAPSAYDSTIHKINYYRGLTTDTMAGPKSDREAKLVSITAGVLDVVKTYSRDFEANLSLLDLVNIGNSGQMPEFGNQLYIILRSCKGIHNETLYNNIRAISTEVDGLGSFMAKKLPKLLSDVIVPVFAKYSNRIDMIEKTTMPRKAA